MRINFAIPFLLLYLYTPALAQEYEIFWVSKFDSLLRAGVTSKTRHIFRYDAEPLREIKVIERYSRTDTGMIVSVVTMVYIKSKNAIDTSSRAIYTYTNT